MGLSPDAVYKLLLVAASPGAEHDLLDTRASEAVVRRLSCPKPCGTFPDQGSDSYSLHWQEDSLTAEPPEKPYPRVFYLSHLSFVLFPFFFAINYVFFYFHLSLQIGSLESIVSLCSNFQK